MVDGVREEVVYIWFYGRLSSSEIHGLIHDLNTYKTLTRRDI